MSLIFERGSSDNPRGHAILYFHDASNSERVLATYVVVLPISMDVTKYIPPMFASQMTGMSFQDFSAFAVPPVPEPVEGLQAVQKLGELRNEDVLNGGQTSSQDPARAMDAVNEVVQEYASLYAQSVGKAPAPVMNAQIEGVGEGVEEVMYQLMSERDRLTEMSKLVGTIRFAAEREDHNLFQESEAKAHTLGKYLSERHKMDALLGVAIDPSERGARLARLYLDRSYRLCDEDYQAVAKLDIDIEEAEKDL